MSVIVSALMQSRLYQLKVVRVRYLCTACSFNDLSCKESIMLLAVIF